MKCRHDMTHIIFHTRDDGRLKCITDEQLICKKCRKIFKTKFEEVDIK